MSNAALKNHDPELYEEFSTAIAKGDVEKVRECIARGVNIIHLSHIDDQTPLGAAAFEGHLEIVKILLDAGADINARQLADGFTALMDAVGGGYLEIVRTLVEAGARVNMQSYQGDTAENIAESNGYEEILEYLQRILVNLNGISYYYQIQIFLGWHGITTLQQRIYQSRLWG